MRRKKVRKRRPEAPPAGPRSLWHRLPKRPAAASLAAAVAVLLLLLLPFPGLNVAGLAGGGRPSTLRAAIVDQLGATQANLEFAESATSLLKEAGYHVDYYPPEAVTVEFYRNLPQGDYDLLVMRTHSTADISRGEASVSSVSLFTNEPYSRERYYDEQVAGRIGFAQYHEGGSMYFGVTADFVRSSMKGRFHGTTVVMMGCQGLLNDQAAQAFAERGAGAFIAWDKLVSAAHTDTATEHLLRHLALDKQKPQQAVATTMAEVGPDPAYGSELLLRP